MCKCKLMRPSVSSNLVLKVMLGVSWKVPWYSAKRTFWNIPWGLYKEMSTNTQGQSDIL